MRYGKSSLILKELIISAKARQEQNIHTYCCCY